MRLDVPVFLSQTFMFKSLKPETITKILNCIDTEIVSYEPKSIIFCPDTYEKKLGFIINGECTVSRIKSDSTPIPYNTLKAGDSFGILAVLTNEEEYPTCITAKGQTKILFINSRDVITVIKKYPTVAVNVIDFLSQKLLFLNKKLSTFSSGSVEKKLASFLYSIYKKNNDSVFDFNCKNSAEALNVGRASLYRAISALEKDGIISLDNKKITIYDLEGLERISK